MFFLALICLSLTSACHGLVAYDCSDISTPVREISLVDVPECVKKEEVTSFRDTIIQLIQPNHYEETEYFSCLVEIDHLTMRCGLTIDTLQKGALSSEILDLGRENCRRLQVSGIFEYNDKTIKINPKNKITYINTETIGSIQDGSCTPGENLETSHGTIERPIRTSKFKVTLGRGKTKADLDDSTLLLPNGQTSRYQDEECFTPDYGQIFWIILEPKMDCNKDNLQPIFEGPATSITVFGRTNVTSYIIHYKNYDFQITLNNQKTEVCGISLLHTEHPNLFITERDPHQGFRLTTENQGRKRPSSIDLMTYINSKLLYAMKHIKQEVQELHNKINFEKCHE